MPSIYSLHTDGYIAPSLNVGPFSSARSYTGSTTVNNTDTTAFRPAVYAFSGRGGVVYRVERAFFEFDTSGITSTVGAASFKFTTNGTATGNSNVIAVKSTAFTNLFKGTYLLQSSDFNQLDFNTAYTGEIDLSSAGSGTRITATLNSTALSDLVSLSRFRIALINYAFDYSNVTPTTATSRQSIRFQNYSGTSSDPEINYTLGSSGPANLTSLNAITKSNITNVNTITLANITSINTIA